MQRPLTPFPLSGYFGSNYFCNREKETDQLLGNCRHGLSTTIISIRRMGKTELIKHVASQLPKNWAFIYLDILYTENKRELLDALATAVINAIPENGKAGKKAWEFIKGLRPLFSFDPLTGAPQVSFNVRNKEAEQNITDVFRLMENHPQPVVIAIDEFQQILNYPESQIDAWLRSIIQQLNNVTFIYSGSQQHLMNDLFTTPSRPFYRSTQLVKLKSIPSASYRNFIIRHFKNHNRSIAKDVVDDMLEWTKLHTYYVQLLCSRVFMTNESTITRDVWHEEARKILVEQEPVFFGYREMLPKKQWQLLKAIATESTLYSPSANDFINNYQLGSSSSVLRALNGLLNKELAYYDFDEEGNKYYSAYDVLFERWVQKNKRQ